MTVDRIAQDPTDRGGRPIGPRDLGGVADQEVAEPFSSGVFFIFSSEALFFGNSFLFFQKASMRKGS